MTSGVLIVGFASASAPSSGLSGLKLTVLILASSGRLPVSCSAAAVLRSLIRSVLEISAARLLTRSPRFVQPLLVRTLQPSPASELVFHSSPLRFSR